MQDAPRLARKLRKEDDPKVIGLWKIGRTIGKGSSGRSRFPVFFTSAKPNHHDRSRADCPPLKDGPICGNKDSVEDGTGELSKIYSGT